VAGLTPVPSGGTGGQLTAARALLESRLAAHVDFVPVSSTMASVPAPRLWKRICSAGKRLFIFLRSLHGADCVLIFSSDGLSLLEKSLMAWAANVSGKGVVMRMSSGNIPRQVERSWLVAWALRLALRSAHVICAQGPRWRDYFSSFREGKGKIREIRNGIVLPPPRAASHPREPTIVFVGWIHEEKGVFDAFRAFELVASQLPEARFIAVGGGRDLVRLAQRVAVSSSSARVRLTGWLPREKALETVAACQVFLLPSHAEGLPNALVEAMALGVPVVATPVGSIPDVVEDERSGLLRRVGDIHALSVAVLRILEDPSLAVRLALEGRRVVEENHDIEQIWPRYFCAILDAACAVRRAAAGRFEERGREP
jgi:glycosyltransferase involved in cell wall biosynthesis